MPTTYTHDRFGKEVYEKLPENLKKTIRNHKKLYLIGLHGPDIFFYYHPFAKNHISDAKIETSLDQYFMLEDGLDPLGYRPAAPICPHTDGNAVIHRCFPEISETEIAACLKGMKLWTSITIWKSSILRNLLLGLMKLAGCYDSMGGRAMPKKPQKECEAGTRNLVHLYERALAEAPQELIKLDDALHGNGSLSHRFEHNFD